MTFQGRLIRHGGLFPERVLRLFRHGRGECENRWMDEHIKVAGVHCTNAPVFVQWTSHKTILWGSLMYPEIGSYDAKTKLHALLREVQAGRGYTITLRGKPVADLVPVRRAGEGETRKAIAAMRAAPRIKGVVAADLERWIAEGRR